MLYTRKFSGTAEHRPMIWAVTKNEDGIFQVLESYNCGKSWLVSNEAEEIRVYKDYSEAK
jgi:hypothetical protein